MKRVERTVAAIDPFHAGGKEQCFVVILKHLKKDPTIYVAAAHIIYGPWENELCETLRNHKPDVMVCDRIDIDLISHILCDDQVLADIPLAKIGFRKEKEIIRDIVNTINDLYQRGVIVDGGFLQELLIERKFTRSDKKYILLETLAMGILYMRRKRANTSNIKENRHVA